MNINDYSFKTMKGAAPGALPAAAGEQKKDPYDDVTIKNDGPKKEELRGGDKLVEEYHAPATGRLNQEKLKAGDELINGRYTILSPLGDGGMGFVYCCKEKVSGVEFAVKTLRSELASNASEMQDFRKNFNLVNGLTHKNIAVYNMLEQDEKTGEYFLVMEYVHGMTLSEWIKRKGAVSLTEALPILRQVAEALDYAHGKKVMHRDIKPENIMLTKEHEVKVLDFGLAARIHSTMTRVTGGNYGATGTPNYMAPEQWNGEEPCAATDQYALAVMAYEMLSGKRPFSQEEPIALKAAVLKDAVKPIRGLSKTVNNALQHALAKNPKDRFASCADFVDALSGARVRLSSSGKSYTRRLVAGLVFVALLAGVFFYMREEGLLNEEWLKAVGIAKEAETATESAEEPKTEVKTDGQPPVESPEHKEKKEEAPAVETLPEPLPDEGEAVLQLQGEVNRLRALLGRQLSGIKSKNYDRGQTFGEHLDALEDNFKAAAAVLSDKDKSLKERYELALKYCKAAQKDVNWINDNVALRSEVGRLLPEVEAERKKAEAEDSERFAGTYFDPAMASLAKAKDSYDKGSFQTAFAELNRAKEGFEQTFAAARATKIKIFLDAGTSDLKGSRWDDAVKNADAVIALDGKNEHAVTLKEKALAGKRQQQVETLLKDAKTAVGKKQWKEARNHVAEVLKLDADNKAARELQDAIADGERRERIDAHLTAARKGVNEGDWETAKREAEEVLKEEHNHAEAIRLRDAAVEGAKRERINTHLAAARNAAKAANWTVARTEAEKVLELEPDNAEARRLKDTALANMNENQPSKGKNFKVRLSDRNDIEMLWVSPGSFTMGSPSWEPGRDNDETQHSVRLNNGFWLGKYEVTHGQWKAVMGTDLRAQVRKALNDDTVYSYLDNKTLRDDWGLSRDADPQARLGNEDDQVAMHYVSYEDCLEFCRRLNERERSAGRLPAGYVYGLPTEAQWEYACRAGTATALYNGPIVIRGENDAPALDAIAWYGGNSSEGYTGDGWNTENWKEKQYPGGNASARNVGGKKPNPWGFYDMIGNVWEWCSDWYGNYGGDATDPKGPSNGSSRVFRGGSWNGYARECRAAYRCNNAPALRHYYLGFRLALVPVQEDGSQAMERQSLEVPARATGSANSNVHHSDFPALLDLSGVRLKMIKVKAGTFQMGSPENELGRFYDEKQHWVTLTQDYWLGETEVTQGQWKAVMGNNPSSFKKGDDYPVENVSWEDAMEFCAKLNQKYSGRLPRGYNFSLPTEAQWEYACRAGTTMALNSGKNLTSAEGECTNLDEVGWYSKNSGGSTHPVGKKRANAWGFYDMHGNVWEWCRDWYGSYKGDVTDPKGPASGSDRVYRGGGWYDLARPCRAAFRGFITPAGRSYGLGFRLAFVPVQ